MRDVRLIRVDGSSYNMGAGVGVRGNRTDRFGASVLYLFRFSEYMHRSVNAIIPNRAIRCTRNRFGPPIGRSDRNGLERWVDGIAASLLVASLSNLRLILKQKI